jgi:hypothetical protein
MHYVIAVYNRSYRGALAIFRSGTTSIGFKLGIYNGLQVD